MRHIWACRKVVVLTFMACCVLTITGGCGDGSGSVPPEGTVVEGKSEEQRKQEEKNMMDYYNSQKGKTAQ